MKVDEFDYDLPPERIAQQAVEPRHDSRLLVVERATGRREHRHFRDLPDYLQSGDVVVVNDTRVLPGRLWGRRPTGGRVEVLLLRPANRDAVDDGETWEVLVRPGRKVRTGDRLEFRNGLLRAQVLGETPAGGRVLRFTHEGGFHQVLDQLGSMPLPPYIKEKPADPERYQTVYAKERGSAAAPTAGLHFTPQLLAQIAARGVPVVSLTLHVGLGTFRPVQVTEVEEHRMEQEYFRIPAATAHAVEAARQQGGRVWAVGTTVTRTLETAAQATGHVESGDGWTGLYIYPGFRFRAVDVLVTNFHLPRSSLLMLVSAFTGRETVLDTYREAIAREYRFYSFGDAMLIL